MIRKHLGQKGNIGTPQEQKGQNWNIDVESWVGRKKRGSSATLLKVGPKALKLQHNPITPDTTLLAEREG